MLLVDDLAAGGTKNLRHTPRGLVTLDFQLEKYMQCNEKMFTFLFLAVITSQ